jgi:hypothetical protein
MDSLAFEFDIYLKQIMKEKEILWVATLNNGQKVYSDYNRFGTGEASSPWIRLCKYMDARSLKTVKVEAMAFGAPLTTILEDANGLDGFFIKRGVIKDVVLESSLEPLQATRLVCGRYNKENDKIYVSIFNWPNNESFKNFEERIVTEENLQYMYFIDKDLEKQLKERVNG